MPKALLSQRFEEFDLNLILNLYLFLDVNV